MLLTTDRKEQINQYPDKVSLTPVDCLYKDFKKSSLADLDSHDDNREDTFRTMYVFFKKIAEASDVNLIQDIDFLIRKYTKLNYSELKWIGRIQLDHSN